MPSFKIFFGVLGGEEIRRFSTPKQISWDEFIGELEKIIPNFHPELRIQYVDTEGDKITISSEAEWRESLGQLKEEPLKFYVCEPQNPNYFKDGPTPKVVGFYVAKDVKEAPKEVKKEEKVEEKKEEKKEEKIEVKEEKMEEKKEEKSFEVEKLTKSVPKSLSQFFKDGKILPYNLPTWLRDSGAVKLKALPNSEVELDVDVNLLFTAYHQRALLKLNEKQLAEAKSLFQAAVELAPLNIVAHYNLACAQALLGETEAALDSLEAAVKLGYAKWEHLEKDGDLFSLHSTPRFQQLLKQLKPEPPKVEPPKVEPLKVEPVLLPVLSLKPREETPAFPKFEVKPIKWANEIALLRDMGFPNTQLVVALLGKHNGNVEQVVLELLR